MVYLKNFTILSREQEERILDSTLSIIIKSSV